MKTRKLTALLLTLVMSLTMGGLTVFADESGDVGTDENPPTITEPAEPNDKPGDPEDLDKTEDLDETEDSMGSGENTDKPDVSIEVTGIPEKPVKAGDTISYTVKVEANGADTTGWYVIANDRLKAEIDKAEIPGEKMDLNGNTATLTYSIPKDFYISSSKYYVDFKLTDGEKDKYGFENIFAQNFGNVINAVPTLENSIDFQVKGLVTDTAYPFAVTWKNTSDYAIKNFSVDIWTEIRDKEGDNYGKNLPTHKVTGYPEGAVVKQESGSVKVENLTIPAGGSIKITGTVSFPAEGKGQLHFNELLNGAIVNQISTTGFTVNVSAGGNGNDNDNTDQKPGTIPDENTVKDKATGITVSGVEEGVALSVKAVNKDQQTAIEEQVKKLLGNTKGIKIFDISLLKDGKEVQPGAPVKVTIPIPEGFGTNLKLYHQNEKGVLEAVNISVKDSNVSFEAKSFSPYVLVDMGVKAVNTSVNGKSPKTGDASTMTLYLMLALAAMGSIGFAAKRKVNG